MRKCLVFVLTLTLVLGSFGFSFGVEEVGETPEISKCCCPTPIVTPGSIKISKTIEGECVGTASAFYFIISNATGTIRSDIEVTVGGFKVIDGLAPGDYIVEEVFIPNGYTPDAITKSAVVVADGECVVNFVNTYEEPCVTTPVGFTIPFTKIVDGEGYDPETFEFIAELFPIEAEIPVASESAMLNFTGDFSTTDGGFSFDLTGAQAAEWLPCWVKVRELEGSSPGWSYTDNPYWVQINEAGDIVSILFNDLDASTSQAIVFENTFEEEPADLRIPIHKVGNVVNGSFGSQTFDFEVSIQDEGGWVDITGASVTLSYPEAMEGNAYLDFSYSELNGFWESYGIPLVLKIVEHDGGAANWSYDDEEYLLELEPCMMPANIENSVDNAELLACMGDLNGVYMERVLPNEWCWHIVGEANEILFQNSYNYTSGGRDRRDRTTTTVPDPEVPLIEDPVPEVVEISIPEADIPLTGGLGFGIFMLIGGGITSYGVRLRKKNEQDEL